MCSLNDYRIHMCAYRSVGVHAASTWPTMADDDPSGSAGGEGENKEVTETERKPNKRKKVENCASDSNESGKLAILHSCLSFCSSSIGIFIFMLPAVVRIMWFMLREIGKDEITEMDMKFYHTWFINIVDASRKLCRLKDGLAVYMKL